MSEKMREDFHKWCDSQGFASDRYEMCDLGEKYKHLCGEYVIPDSRIMWQAWQASLAALVIELPSDINGEYYADGWNAALICVEERLKEAGVSYK